jgi:hypothetical protein
LVSIHLRGPTSILITAVIITVIALLAAGMLGVASAEAPTTVASPPLTVSVQGVAIEPIEQSASGATATAVYRQGMADAVTDGQSKAQFLASKAGVTLGAVQSIVENGGYIGCTGNEVEYTGEQPDFGSPGVGVSGSTVSAPHVDGVALPGASKPAGKHAKKKKHKAPVAKRASAAGCTLTAQISLTYAIS